MRGVVALLSISLALMLFRLWGNGFTSGDEGFTAVARFKLGGVWDAAWAMATFQGRFYHLLVYPLAQVPYLFDSLVAVNFFRILSSGAAVLAFVLFARELFGTRIGLLAAFLYFGLFNTAGGGYNPFHGLPLWFNAGAAILFLSLWLFVKRCRQGRPLHTAYAMLFLAFLAYEPMLFYALAYLPLYFALWPRDAAIAPGQALAAAARRNIGLLVAVGLYVLLYFLFRAYFPSTYQGTSALSVGPVKEMARTIVLFSLNGIYLDFDWQTITKVRIPALMYAVVVTAGVSLSLKLNSGASEKPPRWLPVAAMLVFFVLSPNLLFGLTERYRQWIASEPFYLGSYYSAFALCLLLALLVDRASVQRRPSALRKALSALALCLFAVASYANQVQSLSFYSAARSDALRWELAEQLVPLLRSTYVDAARLCTATFIRGDDVYDYWSFYLGHLAGRPISLRYAQVKDPQCDLQLDYKRERRAATLTIYPSSGAPLATLRASR